MHKLSHRIFELAKRNRARYQPAAYAAEAVSGATTSSAVYTLRPQTGRGPLVILGIECPGSDPLVSILAGSQKVTDGDVFGPHFMDDYDGDDDPGRLTAPIVLGEQSQLRVNADAITTADLPTDELQLWGFHTDNHFADLLRSMGEFWGVTLDTAALSAAGPFERQQHTFSWPAYIERIHEEELVGGESGLAWDNQSLKVGNLELHPDRSGYFPVRAQKAGVLAGLHVGNGSKAVLRGDMTGTPGTGRVTASLLGSRIYSSRRAA